MKILIDADGCPVVHLALKIAKLHNIPCILVCDTAHEFSDTESEVITVSKGADSADFRIVNLLTARDIVVTQDYGLAAMCLARGARAVNQNGLIFDAQNMDALLWSRHLHKQQRRRGEHLKGPKKRAIMQNKQFEVALCQLLQESEKN